MARETGRTGYKAKLIVKLRAMFPGCVIIHTRAEDAHQGIPDLMIIFGRDWAMLEVKASATSEKQPNQEYWVNQYNQLSFASFIYPENELEVLNALQSAFSSSRYARHS